MSVSTWTEIPTPEVHMLCGNPSSVNEIKEKALEFDNLPLSIGVHLLFCTTH